MARSTGLSNIGWRRLREAIVDDDESWIGIHTHFNENGISNDELGGARSYRDNDSSDRFCSGSIGLRNVRNATLSMMLRVAFFC